MNLRDLSDNVLLSENQWHSIGEFGLGVLGFAGFLSASG